MKEPGFIASLLHSEECGRSMLYDVYANEVCSIAGILNHITTLTRQHEATGATSQMESGQNTTNCGNLSDIATLRAALSLADQAEREAKEVIAACRGYTMTPDAINSVTLLANRLISTQVLLEKASRDSQRLDWLESQWREGVILDSYGTCDDVDRGIGRKWNCELDDCTVQADTIREAIDAAMEATP